VRCQFCGHENPERAIYCETCGAILGAQTRHDDPRLREIIRRIRDNIGQRKTSDRILPTYLIWVVIIVSILTFVVAFAPIFFILSSDPWDFSYRDSIFDLISIIEISLSVVAEVLLAVLAYFLVKRHNEHSMREGNLKQNIGDLTRTTADDPKRQEAFWRETRQLGFYMGTGTRTRNPLLWALLLLLPTFASLASWGLFTGSLGGFNLAFGIAGFGSILSLSVIGLVANMYMFYFLGREFKDHEDLWSGFASSARGLLTRLGFPDGRPHIVRLTQPRSFVLYLVLAIFVPFFIYYWWYVILKDPNEHYRNQWEFEDRLLEVLGS